MKGTATQPQEVFRRRPHGGVGQDKNAPARVQPASVQPVRRQTPARPDMSPDTGKHHGSQTRQTEQIAGWVRPQIKAEVKRVEHLNGWSQSKTVATLVEEALAHRMGEQFAVMIRQTIQEAVRQEFQRYTNRMGKLTFSAYLAAEQSRIIGIEQLRNTLDARDIGHLPQRIRGYRQQALGNLKLYNYSITDVEKAATETVPWQ
jgi:hypothetical protein